MNERILIYERVGFDDQGKAISWEKSLDGKNWNKVSWPLHELPFFLTGADVGVKFVTTISEEIREV